MVERVDKEMLKASQCKVEMEVMEVVVETLIQRVATVETVGTHRL